MEAKKHGHYWFDFDGYTEADIYRLLLILEITHPCAQHIFKKVVCAGKRGHKDIMQDIRDIADTANRWADMEAEDQEDA